MPKAPRTPVRIAETDYLRLQHLVQLAIDHGWKRLGAEDSGKPTLVGVITAAVTALEQQAAVAELIAKAVPLAEPEPEPPAA